MQLLSPFTQVFRRSAPKGAGDILTGRWVIVDNTGLVVVPGTGQAGKPGSYLCLEGNLLHLGTSADFDNTTKASTKNTSLPSVVAAGQCALAYGVFRYSAGPESFDPGVAAPAVGDLMMVDRYGRLVTQTGSNAVAAKVESVTLDVNSLVATAVLRTMGV